MLFALLELADQLLALCDRRSAVEDEAGAPEHVGEKCRHRCRRLLELGEDEGLLLAAVRHLTDAAGFRFQRKGHEFVHPVASFVVARDGMIVRYLYGTTFLPKDLTLALLEARNGKAGAAVRKVVGYCFSFDPKTKTYVFNLLRISATVVLTTGGAFLAFLLLGGRKRRPSGR